MITGLQAQLDKVSDMIDGTSGLSLGDQGSNAAHRIAAFESNTPGYTYGSYFYGMGLCTGPAVGLGLWGGSGAVLPDQTGAGGTLAHMFISATGNVGVNNQNPLYTLDVNGSLYVSNSIASPIKNFDIPHPDPGKPDMRLRHWCIESDVPGGMVMYRRTIDMTSTMETIEMPSWFSHLTKDVIVQVTPYQHFGSAWGECNGNTIELHATTLGKWHVLITGARKDDCAVNYCPQEVEYVPAPPNPPQGFPTS